MRPGVPTKISIPLRIASTRQKGKPHQTLINKELVFT